MVKSNLPSRYLNYNVLLRIQGSESSKTQIFVVYEVIFFNFYIIFLPTLSPSHNCFTIVNYGSIYLSMSFSAIN